MIGDWLAQTPALLAALVIVLLPGLAIGAALRLRGLALWALAPVGSTAVLAVLAIAYGAMHVRWEPLWVGLGCVVLAGLAWLCGRALGPRRRPAPPGRRALWLLGAGLAIGIGFIIARFVVYVQDPNAISETNDAIFHLNALRYVVDTGSASSFQISGVIGARSFYPAAWHAIASLVALLSGCSVPVAANMTALVVSAVIWPLGIAWLTREITRGSAAAAGIAAALSASLWAFPMLMVEWGVLYPFALSVALLPASAAILVAAPRWAEGEGPVRSPRACAVLSIVLAIAAAGALALAQPANLLSWGLIAMISFTWWFGMHVRSRSGHRRSALIIAFVAGWIVFLIAWLLLTRATTGAHWPSFRGRKQALVDIILNGPVMLPYQIGVSILMIIGLAVAVWRAPLRWLATTWLAFGALYYASAAIANEAVRRWLLGAWYADPYRFASLLPVAVIPLAAIGLTAVAVWATGAISGRRGRPAFLFAGAWSLVAVVGLLALAFAVRPIIQLPGITEGNVDAESRYTTPDFLSPDGRAVLERLPKTTPPGSRIIGNPSTGMAFGYMLSGRDVYPRTWQPPATPAWNVLAQNLRDAASDPAVCAALKAFGSPRYVLDFGPGESSPGRYVMPGFTGLAGQRGFTLVDKQGDASLWRITACAS